MGKPIPYTVRRRAAARCKKVCSAASIPGYRTERIRRCVHAPLKIWGIDGGDVLVFEYLAEAGIVGGGVLRVAHEVYKLRHEL